VDDAQARERVAEVDALLESLETLPDPVVRQTAMEVVEALLDLYGEGLARLWVTALANHVDTPYVKATGSSVLINLPQTPDTPEATLEWKIPQWSNAIERDRARIYFVAYAAGMALHFVDRAFKEIRAGRLKVFEDFDVPDEAIGCGCPAVATDVPRRP